MVSQPDPGLNREEREKARELAAIRAPIINEVVRREGEEELERSALGLGWSGLAAGLSMGFSLIAEGLLRAHLPDAPWRPLVSKVGYTFGFLIVILGKQQLYTENTLTPVVPFMTEPSLRSLKSLLRLWTIVLFTNLAGAAIVAWMCAKTSAFDPSVHAEFARLGSETFGADFGATFFRGIFGGWLIALIGWIIAGFRGDGVAVVLLLSYLVGLGHFSHVVAGSIDTLYLVFTGGASWGRYAGSFLAPSFLGNTVGGVLLVALVNHAQSRTHRA